MSFSLTREMYEKLSPEIQVAITSVMSNKDDSVNTAFLSATKDFGKPLVLPQNTRGSKSHMVEIPVISPLHSTGPHAHNWPDNWFKMFKRPILKEHQVISGDRGSIGIGYDLNRPLTEILHGIVTKNEMIARIMNFTAGRLNQIQAGYIVEFYNFSIQNDQPYFAIKKGVQGKWLARKISSIYWRDSDLPFDGILQNRFDFEIVRALSGSETDMTSGSRYATIKFKSIEVPK